MTVTVTVTVTATRTFANQLYNNCPRLRLVPKKNGSGWGPYSYLLCSSYWSTQVRVFVLELENAHAIAGPQTSALMAALQSTC